MRTFLLSLLAFLALPIVALAAAQPTFSPSVIPLANSTYYLGTTTPSTNAWKGIVVDQICLTGDTCRTTWPTGGSGNVFGYPFPGNATSTTLHFSQGIIANASSTFSFLASGLVGNSQGSLYSFASSSLFGFTPASNARLISTTYPLQGGGDLTADRTLTLAFGTTTSNTWGSTQTFTNPINVGSLSGLIGGNSGALYAFATSTIKTSQLTNDAGFLTSVSQQIATTSGLAVSQLAYFTKAAGVTTLGGVATSSFTVGSGLSYSGTIGSFVGGAAGTLSVSGLTMSNFASANVSQWTNDAGYLTSAVTSLKQSFGMGQTGTLTLATSSAATSNGVTVGQTITNSGGTFTFTPTVSVSAIPNSALANSTISGIALGSNLNSLSHDSTLSGTSYNGSAAVSDWGLNLAHANTWTALQTLGSGFISQASSTIAAAFNVIGQTYFGGNVGIGTTTPRWPLQIATGTVPQLTLSDGSASSNHFSWRAISNWLFLGTSSPSTFATSTYPILSITPGGQVSTQVQVPATSTAITLDFKNTPNQVEYQLGSSATTITLINATNTDMWGATKRVWHCNPPNLSAGAVTWVGVEWIGSAATQTTTANQCDLYSFDVTRATSTTAYKVAGAASTGFQ